MSSPSNYCVFAGTIFVSIVTLGVNAITIVAALTKKSLDKPSYKFILGLAVSDGLMGIFLPADIINKTFFEQRRVKETYADYFSYCFLPIFPVLILCCSSNVIQMVIALDRYLSVIKPVLYHNFLTKRIANRTVVAIFLFAAFVSSMPIYWNNFPNKRITKSCTILTFAWPYYIYVVAPLFGVNLGCLTFIYVEVYRVAATRLANNAKTIKMVAVILTCHAACWFPHMVCTFLLLKDALPKEDLNEQEYSNPELYSIYHWFLLLALSSSMLNALLYSWRMPDFRKAIDEIISGKKTVSATDRCISSINVPSLNATLTSM